LYAVSAQYLDAVRNGGRYTVVVDAWRNDAPVFGGKDLPVASGSVTDSSTPGVRRQLDLELTPEPGQTVQGLFDLLSPIGTELRVRSLLHYPNNVSSETVPLGVFDVDAEDMGYAPGGTLTVRASDKWVKIQRARFVTPYASNPLLTITAQIATLIRRALGNDEPVTVTATSTAMTPRVVWERNMDETINNLAQSIGAWVYFDRDGRATIADLPADDATPSWAITSDSAGVLLDASRSRDRSKTYNMVVVTGELVDNEALFTPVVIQDQDANSPTYVAGPFGQVPYFYSSPLLTTSAQASKAGRSILARVKGLNAQLTLSTVRNHALDALDAISVSLPRERWDVPSPAVETHLVDKVVHPLTAESVQSVDTRSTRTDELESQ
jgi:hypothetical protein